MKKMLFICMLALFSCENPHRTSSGTVDALLIDFSGSDPCISSKTVTAPAGTVFAVYYGSDAADIGASAYNYFDLYSAEIFLTATANDRLWLCAYYAMYGENTSGNPTTDAQYLVIAGKNSRLADMLCD